MGAKGKVRWLDYAALFKSYLHVLGKDATLESIYYFTALAYHIADPNVVVRHQTYIRCLQETGVKVQLGRFKATDRWCPHCGKHSVRHEEKETDVAIAVKMFELLHNDECDCVVIVTGDTDLAPAARTAVRLFPSKQIAFAFPYRRKSNELAHIVPMSFKMGRGAYAQHQLPDPFSLSDGTTVARPSNW